jgi:[ribosomal protein S5]-alanine N-acetyltransferase
MGARGTIVTERLSIVPFKAEFLTEHYVSWLNDPEVVRYSEQRFKHHSISSCREYMESFDGSPNFFWAITTRSTGSENIGTLTAYVDVHNKVADVGILIGDKTRWGKGYGAEAFRAVIDFLFREAGVRKVTAGTMAANKAMMALMRQASMEEECRRKRHFLLNDREVDLVHGAIFRENWKEGTRSRRCEFHEDRGLVE